MSTGQFPIPEYAPPPAAQAADDGAVGFVLRLGPALHMAGYPAHLLERSLQLVSERFGLQAQFFSTPTSIFAAFGSPDRQRTYLTRVQPSEVNLSRLSQLDRVMREVLAGEVSALQGSVRVENVLAARDPYPAWLVVVAFGLASAAVSVFLGAGFRGLLVSLALGLVTGTLALLVAPYRSAQAIFEPMAAFTVALLAALAGVWTGRVATGVVTLSGLVVLLPGLMLTVAMTELATQHLASGTARLSGALITFLSIAFGVALATRIATLFVSSAPMLRIVPLPGWTEWVALLVAPLAFAVLLKAPPRDAGWIVAAGVLSYVSTKIGRERLGPELGAFLGALVIGVASDIFARVFRRPSSIPQVPGVLMIVPGSVGYRGLMSMLNDQVIVGIEGALQAALIGVSIVAGLLVSNVFVPGERLGD